MIAEAVDDPSLEVVYRTSGDPAEWVDDRGRPVALPEASRTRATTEIRSGGVPSRRWSMTRRWRMHR